MPALWQDTSFQSPESGGGMFIRRYHGEIIFHLFSLVFFDLIYFILLLLLLIKESPGMALFSLLVFGYLHLQYFRNFCRRVRWSYVFPHIAFPVMLSIVAFLVYFP
ncbi:MAG: hypothetical protein R3231_07460 [bacterium]|nr:hypothetical protein [bacterium]